jgi:hypothetical protein
MSCNNGDHHHHHDDDDECENDIFENDRDNLVNNIGRFITVFTSSGGASGSGFTGLLVEVNCHFIKLITSFPSAPRHPFGLENTNIFNDRRDRDRDCDHDHDHDRSRFGTVIIIPIRHIVSFVFNEI